MKSIPLTQGKIALVDDGDFEWLNRWKWHFHGEYAARHGSRLFGAKRIYMHRIIMNTPIDMHTDHINGDKLDNRRQNLRICTQAENNKNIGLSSANKSGYKGVCWDKNRNKWSAEINSDGKKIHLGRFDELDDAIHAYEEAAKKNHDEFARINK